MVVVVMGSVVIASVFVAVWHKALPADGPSLGRPVAGVIRLDGGSAIVREADKQEGPHVGRRKSCYLLVGDEDVVTALKLVAKGGIAAALKLQKSGAMLLMPGGDVGIGSCLETLALAGHARVVIINCKQTGYAVPHLETCVQCIKEGGLESGLLGCKAAVQWRGNVFGGAVM